MVVVLVLPFAAWMVFNFYEKNIQKLPVLGRSTVENGTKQPHRVAAFELTNQEGEKMSTESWKGRIVVVDFFFTHCPVVCPTMTENLKKVQEAFRDDEEILINSLSVDPERDDPAQLTRFANKFGVESPQWQMLTGDKKEIYRLARNSFMVVATDGDGGPDDFIHSEKLVLVDRQRRIRGFYDGTDESEVNQLIKDIKRLKNEK